MAIRSPASADAFETPYALSSILNAVRNHSGNCIVSRDGLRFSYTQLYERVCQLANVLSRAGVGPGDTVVLMEPGSQRYLECLLAVPMLGAELHILAPGLQNSQLSRFIGENPVELMLVHENFLPQIESLSGQGLAVNAFLLLCDGAFVPSTALNSIGDYEGLLERADNQFSFVDPDLNTPVISFYLPQKADATAIPSSPVQLSHAQLIQAVQAALCTMQAQPACDGQLPVAASPIKGDVYMPILPLPQVEAIAALLLATYIGLQQVYPGSRLPAALVRLIRDEGVTCCHCQPEILALMLSCRAADDVDFSYCRAGVWYRRPDSALLEQARAQGLSLYSVNCF